MTRLNTRKKAGVISLLESERVTSREQALSYLLLLYSTHDLEWSISERAPQFVYVSRAAPGADNLSRPVLLQIQAE